MVRDRIGRIKRVGVIARLGFIAFFGFIISGRSEDPGHAEAKRCDPVTEFFGCLPG